MKKIDLAKKAELMFDNEKFTDLYDKYVKNAVKDPILVRKKLEMRDVWYKSSDPDNELMSVEGGMEFDVSLISLVCIAAGAMLAMKLAKNMTKCAVRRAKEKARKLQVLRDREREAFRMKLTAQNPNA